LSSYGYQSNQVVSNYGSSQSNSKVVDNKKTSTLTDNNISVKTTDSTTDRNLNEEVDKILEMGVNRNIGQVFEPRIISNIQKVKTTNPCSADVLRMSDIMLFKDPTDKTSYLICTDINVFHSMPCPEGTVFREEIHHCVPEGYEAPKCPDSFCKNDADCLIDELNQPKCICKVGFTGPFCEVNIDECALGGNQACAGINN